MNGGAIDPLGEVRDVIDRARRPGVWLHVDGAFGLWARAEPSRRHLLDGVERADSWATDAHKWLNTPYDCGMAICAHDRRRIEPRFRSGRRTFPCGDDAGASRSGGLQPRVLQACPLGPCLGGVATARLRRAGEARRQVLSDGRTSRERARAAPKAST